MVYKNVTVTKANNNSVVVSFQNENSMVVTLDGIDQKIARFNDEIAGLQAIKIQAEGVLKKEV